MKKLTCFKAYDIRGKLGEELNEDIAWRARGATKKGTVAPEELQLIKAKINVLIG